MYLIRWTKNFAHLNILRSEKSNFEFLIKVHHFNSQWQNHCELTHYQKFLPLKFPTEEIYPENSEITSIKVLLLLSYYNTSSSRVICTPLYAGFLLNNSVESEFTVDGTKKSFLDIYLDRKKYEDDNMKYASKCTQTTTRSGKKCESWQKAYRGIFNHLFEIILNTWLISHDWLSVVR